MPAYARWSRRRSPGAARPAPRLGAVTDRLAVNFGAELTKIVPGRVSTEVDATLSFDTPARIAKARQLIAAYDERGIGRERILIKIASTWEGAQAAATLQREGIDCNMTLLFSMAQAIASADAGAFLISPFVGRILDWHVKAGGGPYTSETDPGVVSVQAIYAYYKAYGIKTVVMGASFRNTGEIEALAGCDRLTIAPDLLDKLVEGRRRADAQALARQSQAPRPARIAMDEKTLPLDDERGPDGDREARRRHPHLRPRPGEAPDRRQAAAERRGVKLDRTLRVKSYKGGREFTPALFRI